MADNTSGTATNILKAENASYGGVDVLKAASIIFVIIGHVHPITRAMLPDSSSPLVLIAKQLILFYYFHIGAMSVPIFVFVSIYFFITRLSADGNYWRKRFLRMLQIYVFWVGIQFIVYLLLGGSLPLPLGTIFRNGGPDISYGTFMPPMPSIFYYLYVLFMCTILAFVFVKLPEKLKLILSIIVVVATCLYFFLAPLYGISMDTRSMKNFYVYIPAAYYLYHYKDKLVQYRWFYVTMFCVSVVVEHMFMDMTSVFGRPSVFFGTLIMVSILIPARFTASAPTRFISKYTLGIFALHPYCLVAVLGGYSVMLGENTLLMPRTLPEGIVMFFIISGLTCLMCWLLGKTKLRTYVS